MRDVGAEGFNKFVSELFRFRPQKIVKYLLVFYEAYARKSRIMNGKPDAPKKFFTKSM